MDPARAPPRFQRRLLRARPHETLTQALGRWGSPFFQRSIRYHRPRAPFCGIGHCTNCLVRVNGVPAVRACQYVPAAGDRIETESGWPSPSFDLLGIIDYIFPGGVDTLRGFRRPGWATPLYQRVVRRLAGYGSWPTPTGSAGFPVGSIVEGDVVIVGAGASGRQIARALEGYAGTRYLIDRGPIADVPAGTETLSDTTAIFLPPPDRSRAHPFTLIAVNRARAALRIAAKQVVVAVGGYDGNLLFEGNDRPGIVTAEGLFGFYPDPTTTPFSHAVLVGGGARAAQVLDRFGAHISAVVAPGEIEPGVARSGSAQGIPLYPRTLVLGASGRRHVRRLSLKARGEGIGFSVGCDQVILGHRRLPNSQLFFQAGAQMTWRSGTGAYFPLLNTAGSTTVEGLFAAGFAGGSHEPSVSAPTTETIAGALRAGNGATHPWPAPSGDRPTELLGYYRELLKVHRTGKWISCACEDVLLDEVEEAVARGYQGIEVIKRYTSLGTGLCQGRYCLPEILLVLALLEGHPPEEVGYITQRPPVIPTALGSLAGLPSLEAGPP
ncbi:MAG: 2Fe-2S iron-sulfur cluster-binding protein [Thermoplasmata archaeon]